MEHWQAQGRSWTVEGLIEACESLPAPDQLLEVDDPGLLLPGNMPGRINSQLAAAGKAAIAEVPENAPCLANLIFHSLAARYAAVLRDLVDITGKKLKRLFVVGGGRRNAFLNCLTAGATGLEIILGAAESATIGNLAIQLAVLEGDYKPSIGVTSSAVARWAEVLATQEIKSSVAPAQSVLIR